MPFDSWTKSLLHFNGTNTSTTFTDEIGNTWTPHGNAQISTAQFEFGGASGLFDGINSYIDTPITSGLHFGSNDFTVDFWFKQNTIHISQFIYDIWNSGSGNKEFVIYIGDLDPDNIQVAYTTDGTNATAIMIPYTEDTSWHHFAFVRSGNTYYGFIDGVQSATGSITGTIYSTTQNPAMGFHRDGSQYYFDGYIDEFRVSNGIARWTANFTPPTQEYQPSLSTWKPKIIVF